MAGEREESHGAVEQAIFSYLRLTYPDKTVEEQTRKADSLAVRVVDLIEDDWGMPSGR